MQPDRADDGRLPDDGSSGDEGGWAREDGWAWAMARGAARWARAEPRSIRVSKGLSWDPFPHRVTFSKGWIPTQSKTHSAFLFCR